MTTDNITRVRYFEKQFLRTKDFATEQAYHIAMRRRHNIAHHYWGIVHGLELAEDEGGLFVKPGMAVDGYGRELVLGMRKPLSSDEFTVKARDDLDVWLVYTRRSSDRAPEGYNSCGPAGAEYYRWQEEPLVRLSKPEAGGTRPREPEIVPREVLNNTGSHLTPPDDPQQQWPVYLGRILRDNSDPENPIYSVDMANRPYAGLVGEAIKAPSGRAAVLLGDEVTAATDEKSAAVQSSRFSVVLSDDECSEREALRIDACGEITVKGKASVHGDVQVEGGAVEFKVGVSSTSPTHSCNASPLGGPGSKPRPWRMYRYKCQSDSGEVEQMRIEMSPQLGEKGEVVIGSWSPDDERFKPILSVSNDSKVTVHGDLIVEGQTTGTVTPVPVLPSIARKMTAEAENFLLGSYAGGIGGANLQIGKFYHSPFGEAVDLNTPEGIKNAIDYISADSARLDALVDVLFDNPVASQAFVEKLMGEDSGRRLVMDQLVTNPSARNGFSALLQENIYSDVLDPFALNMVATTDGREAVMNSLVSSSSELATFADLLTDARYTDRADEFASAVSKTNEGREGFMQALPAASTELTNFAQLLTNGSYFDRLPAFAENVMATEDGRRSTIENGMPLNSAELQNFAELLRDFYPVWLTQILDQIKLTDPGADAIANNILTTGSGRAACVRDLMADVARLQDFVNRVLDEQLGRQATADSFEGVDAGDTAANTRRDLFSNLDWLSLGADATPADWTANYSRFAGTTRPRFC